MRPGDILTELANQGVQVWVDGDRLRYRAPKGVLNPAIMRQLTENKQELLRFLTREDGQVGSNLLLQIEPAPDERYQPFPLTDLQLTYWIGRDSVFEIGNVGNHAYMEVEALDLDLQRMQFALQRLIERHEMLRAILLPDGQQQILEHVPSFHIKVFDLREKEPEAVTAHLEQIRRSWSHQLIQVDQWPAAFDLGVTLLDQRHSRLHLSIELFFVDAWSVGILIREFSMLYADPDTLLAPLTLSFRDYIATWEHERSQSPAYWHAREYWLRRFPELPPALELPLTTNPHALAQPRFVPYESRLDADLWGRLKARAARSGITPSNILLAAFAEVLATWSKNSRFSINFSLSNRQPLHPQVDTLVGDFASFVPVAFDYTSHEAFENRARQVQDQILDHLEQSSHYSGMRILRDIAEAQGKKTGEVLFVVFTSMLNQTDANFYSSTGPWGKLVYAITQTPQVWLDHQVLEIRGALVLAWQVVEELFPEGLIASMFEAYCQLLQRLATEEDAWHDMASSLVPPVQLEQQTQLNETEAPLSEELLHTLFARQALQAPSSIAVVAATRTVTYQQLHYGAIYLARWLRAQGAQPNRLIAIVMEKGWEQIMAALSILYAGAAYVPIDPELPQERLTYLLENAEVNIILTQSWLDDKIVWAQHHQRFHVDKLDLEHLEQDTLSFVQTPHDLAYVIYTSGSTGQPKGVAIDHLGAVNTILDINERFKINENDRALALSALSFDLSVYDIFGTLAAGGAIVLPPEEARRDPACWLRLLRQERITVWNSVPALLQMLVDYARGSGEADWLRGSLRLVLLSGDWIPLTLPGHLKEHLPEAEVISLGGATEASIWSILYPIEQVQSEWKSIPYGRPMRNQRWYVLNERLDPCPTWVPGQLYIGGVGLAQGYWRDEKKTQERFIIHQTGERLYWTGDLGRYLPDGTIEFLGREDFQVKIRGHRIELGEIEETLSQHPDVEAAVVIVSATAAQAEKRLIAYVVLHSQVGSERENSNTKLRQFLREKLPEYMVPAAIVVMESLPLTANGKVDRKSLPLPEAFLASDQEKTFVPARTELEKTVVSIWQELLPSAQVGVHDNFFELGGHSLLVIRLANKLFEALHLRVSLQELFRTPTVADQARLLETLQANRLKELENWVDEYAPDTDQLPQIVPDIQRRYDPYPLTDLQQAYWIGQTSLFEVGNFFGHGYTEIEFAQLDLERLNQALQRLISHHEGLRRIILPDGRQQVLEVVPPYRLAITDLRGLPEKDQQEQLLAIRGRMCRQGLDTGHWPLWELRATLLGPQRLRLHFNHSLILLDARSLSILSKELMQLYQNEESVLPTLELTGRDYILALRELEQSELYKRSLAYWQRRLATLPPAPQLPLLKQPRELKEAHFVSHSTWVDAQDWLRLKSLAAAHGLTPNAVLYTAYALALATWSKTAHFTINMLFINRFAMHPQVDELVGNFSTTLLLEVDLREPGSFLSHAKRLQEQLWNDLAHSYVNGVRVVREVARTRGWTSQAIATVTFSSALYTNEEMKNILSSQGRWNFVHHSIETPQVYIDHEVYEIKSSLILKWDVMDDLFAEGMSEEMLAAYGQLLHRLANDEAMWQAQTRSLVPAEHLRLYRRVNATEGPISSDLLHMLVRRQTSERPTQRAVVSSQRTLNYAEVARLATQIGHWLRQREACPNTLVAVVMEKGWEQVVATLGVLEAGAAYLPLDPTLPQERLWYVLRDAQVRLVLTQSWVEAQLAWPEGIERLCVDREEALAELPYTPLTPLQQAEDLAYVIYTSGSTGVPKGVMIDHRGAVNTILDINERCQVGSQDRILALSALSFDLSVYDIFGTLSAGGVIVIPDAGASPDPAHWAQLLNQEQITIWNSVPAFIELLVEYLDGRHEQLANSLRLVMLSGDWIPVPLPERIRALCSNSLQIMSLGGATEASIWSILYPIEKVQSDWRSIPYGRPMRNQHMYVLDTNLQQRAPWVPGQIYIGGIGLAKGYWHDQAKTDASFILNPHTQERLYRTGDLGRYLPDGTIEFLGREDLQVKVQGYRIELGEIEAILQQYPGVYEAIATVDTTGQGEKHLTAYIVPSAEQEVDLDALRAFARTKLPGYMVPATIISVETLPLTSNGKVDRKALLARHEISSSVQKAFTPPRDALEQHLVKLWEAILERPSIGVTDNFFELGGNSLGALRLMEQIRQQFAQDLPLSLLFEGATIARLAELLREHSKQPTYRRSPLVSIQPRGSKPPLFCIHPVGGNVLCYAELARLLGEDQPFYALQSPGLENDEAPDLSIEEMAAYYREAIQTVQPAGPYFLGGWSMGGVVAFEMARQIRGEGQEVALLMLLDSEVPSTPEEGLDDAQLLAWFAKDLAGSSSESLAITPADLRELKPEAQLTYVLERARLAQILAPETDISSLRRLVRVFKANAQALASYVPEEYPYPAVLFPASETLNQYAHDHALGWDKVIGDTLEMYPLSGNHYTMLTQPQVQELAKLLRQHIKKAIYESGQMRDEALSQKGL